METLTGEPTSRLKPVGTLCMATGIVLLIFVVPLWAIGDIEPGPGLRMTLIGSGGVVVGVALWLFGHRREHRARLGRKRQTERVAQPKR